MNTIFDIGAFDGADTQYYLEAGYRVIAVEANPALCDMIVQRLQRYVLSDQLVVENVALSNTPGMIDLHVCGQDLGSSSIRAERLTDRAALGKYTVPAVTYQCLVQKHGKPVFVKVDIEGADKDCVMSLTYDTAPPFLSFEAHHDVKELIDHCYESGYRHFKIIHQNSFRCIQQQDSLRDAIKHKLIRIMGYDRPAMVRMAGRLFRVEHSAGPAPWESDGRFKERKHILEAWAKTKRRGWYDVHAARRDAHAHLIRNVLPVCPACRGCACVQCGYTGFVDAPLPKAS